MFTAIKMLQLCKSALRLNLNTFHHFAICHMIQGSLQNRKTISIKFENTFFRSFSCFTCFLLPFLRWPQIHGKHKSVRKRTHKWVRGRQSQRESLKEIFTWLGSKWNSIKKNFIFAQVWISSAPGRVYGFCQRNLSLYASLASLAIESIRGV